MVMRAFLCFALLPGILAAPQCPPEYNLMEGRCIRALVLKTGSIIDNELPNYRAECGKDNAHLPIIKNDEENNIFNDILNSLDDYRNTGADPYILLDLVCNSTTRRLEWADGTVASYSPQNSVNFDFDCVADKHTAYSEAKYDAWLLVPSNRTSGWYTVMCVYEPCGADFTPIDIAADGKQCIKIHTSPLSWIDAQMECAASFGSLLTINSAEENMYFWRTAISNSFLYGMHIGAHLSSNNQWAWVDGEVSFGGESYDNFANFFPVLGGGNCSSMNTENTAAFWVNEDCNNNKLPFICRREELSIIAKTSPTVAPKAGEEFLSPGFPDSDVPCEYFLIVAADKRVKLEVITLVADENKDVLEILEGTSGPRFLANLTGTILTTTKVTTVESNVMRVNWKPNGSGSGRGFRIRYHEIEE